MNTTRRSGPDISPTNGLWILPRVRDGAWRVITSGAGDVNWNMWQIGDYDVRFEDTTMSTETRYDGPITPGMRFDWVGQCPGTEKTVKRVNDGNVWFESPWSHDPEFIVRNTTQYQLISTSAANHPEAVSCKGAPCGMPDRVGAGCYQAWGRNDPAFSCACDVDGGVIYCSPACRDAAKPKAPTCADRREGTPCELAPGHDGAHRNGHWSWKRNPTTFQRTDAQPVPQPAPWKCIMVDCTTPSAPSATCKGASWCVVCEDKDAYRRTKERDEEAAEGRERRRQANRRAALPAYHGPLTGMAQINRSPPQTIGRVVVSGGRVAGLDSTWEE